MKQHRIHRPSMRTKHIVYAIHEMVPDVPKDFIERVLAAYKTVVLKAAIAGYNVQVAVGSIHLRWKRAYRRMGKGKVVRTYSSRWKCKVCIGTAFDRMMKEKVPAFVEEALRG